MLYADDFSIMYRSSSLITIKQILQDATCELLKWSNTSGFRFSAEKTKLIIFNNKNKNKMSINMGKNTIKNEKNIKILGITFDSKCSWTPHILQLKQACTNRLNIIKTLSHTSWGAHSSVLIKIHKAIILAKLDYGSALFSSANHRHLKMLETLHNIGMRLAIGAFQSSPIDSISNIAGIPSLSLRWAEQKTLLAARVYRSPQGISSSPLRIFKNLQDKFDLDHIIPSTISLQPPWSISLDINFDLHHLPKKDTNPKIYKYIFNEIIDKAEPHTQIYTDASIIDQ